jgi:hypothetical protein
MPMDTIQLLVQVCLRMTTLQKEGKFHNHDLSRTFSQYT